MLNFNYKLIIIIFNIFCYFILFRFAYRMGFDDSVYVHSLGNAYYSLANMSRISQGKCNKVFDLEKNKFASEMHIWGGVEDESRLKISLALFYGEFSGGYDDYLKKINPYIENGSLPVVD